LKNITIINEDKTKVELSNGDRIRYYWENDGKYIEGEIRYSSTANKWSLIEDNNEKWGILGGRVRINQNIFLCWGYKIEKVK